MEISEKIKQERSKTSLSQEALAEAVGVSRHLIGKWENGSSQPNADQILPLAKAFGISVDELERLNPDHMTNGYWYANPGDVVNVQ